MNEQGGFVYIMSNPTNTVLYTGSTCDLARRVEEHQLKVLPGSFSARYHCIKLVYSERCESLEEAILREKQIKGGSRKKKESLIKQMNPKWNDLACTLEI